MREALLACDVRRFLARSAPEFVASSWLRSSRDCGENWRDLERVASWFGVIRFELGGVPCVTGLLLALPHRMVRWTLMYPSECVSVSLGWFFSDESSGIGS